MPKLLTVCHYIGDHLTKALGALGTTVMTLALLDPATIHEAAVTYLGPNSLPKIGIVLFVMVIFRGWYTGKKLAQLKSSVPPAP